MDHRPIEVSWVRGSTVGAVTAGFNLDLDLIALSKTVFVGQAVDREGAKVVGDSNISKAVSVVHNLGVVGQDQSHPVLVRLANQRGRCLLSGNLPVHPVNPQKVANKEANDTFDRGGSSGRDVSNGSCFTASKRVASNDTNADVASAHAISQVCCLIRVVEELLGLVVGVSWVSSINELSGSQVIINIVGIRVERRVVHEVGTCTIIGFIDQTPAVASHCRAIVVENNQLEQTQLVSSQVRVPADVHVMGLRSNSDAGRGSHVVPVGCGCIGINNVFRGRGRGNRALVVKIVAQCGLEDVVFTRSETSDSSTGGIATGLRVDGKVGPLIRCRRIAQRESIVGYCEVPIEITSSR